MSEGKLKPGSAHKHNPSKPGLQKQAGKDDGGLSKHTYNFGNRSYGGRKPYGNAKIKGFRKGGMC